MKKFNIILLAVSCLVLSNCSNDEKFLATEAFEPDVIVFQERDPSLPEVKASPIVMETDVASRTTSGYIGDSRLGYSYAVGNSIVGNQENVRNKVIDIDIVKDIDPGCITEPNYLNHFGSSSFTYSDYDSFESHLADTKKIDKGFSINLGIFKIGRKKTNDETFTSDLTGSNTVVFGELSMEYQNTSYTLLATDGDRKFYARECLNKTFKQNLYSSTIGSIIESYGEFVLTGYITGGKAFALYAGYGSSDKTISERNDGLQKDINLSFSWKDKSVEGNHNFGNTNGNSSTDVYNTDYLYTKLFVWGGNSQGIGFDNATELKTVSINLDPWINSLNNENTHGIIDVTENGLYSISDFILEKNFKERMRNTIAGYLSPNPSFMTPRIDICYIYTKIDNSGNALYDIAPVLITRQGDRIIMRSKDKNQLTDAELSENNIASIFTQKASDIAKQKKEFYGLRIRSVSSIKINPQINSPLCFDLGQLNESDMFTYVNPKTDMEYVYDPTRKIALSLYIGGRDGDVILDDYGIRDWVESLPSKTISIANLANNYTIIGL